MLHNAGHVLQCYIMQGMYYNVTECRACITMLHNAGHVLQCYIMQFMYYNASFVNLQLHNYLLAVSFYREVVEESNQVITCSLY